MIKSFHHRGLQRFHEDGDVSKIRTNLAARVEDVLAHLDQAIRVADVALPGYRLHQLKGARKGTWSITISGNWRITFRFHDGDAFEVDLEDYH